MGTARTYGGSDDARAYAPGEWANLWRRGRSCASRWTLFELATMVLGFMVFWPIGLAVFAYKMWQRKSGADDLQTVVTAKWNEARASWTRSSGWSWSPAGTGNAAFDQWKAAELARLEAERRKLEDAAREFAEFLDNIRHAKDREEFDRFMAERRAKP
ncbi:MAG: DUF2852 domain-containing protein [Roseiarcus sp.]|jgi:hypothetical protein|uniref:DUF2852 domain-containing protein n=1 Tax=Roseiarcus sp. TaxID=1969460 RepID=UPI003C135969